MDAVLMVYPHCKFYCYDFYDVRSAFHLYCTQKNNKNKHLTDSKRVIKHFLELNYNMTENSAIS